jgi:hypothetical protein
MTPGWYWYVTLDLNLLSLTMGIWANSNVISEKCVCKRIMASKPIQVQVTTYHTQGNEIIERLHKDLYSQ